MKNNETKELKTRNGMYLLKKEEMRLFRGGDNSDRPADGETKDQVFE